MTSQGTKADMGRFVELEQVAAAGLPDQRLSIWLPPGYDSGTRRYPVLYMHDGHNLFDPAKSNFNKVWAADRAMLAAMASGKVQPHIIVGIWAPGADRYRQYLPQSIYDAAEGTPRAAMEAMTGGPVMSRAYLDWLAGPLKQRIDRDYRTQPGRESTTIMGSSMGGLMSCYAFLERPEVYGRAGCVSSHWPAADPRAVGEANPELIALWDGWFAARLGKPDGRRLWMDHGTATLDQYYAPYQQAIDARFAAQGWAEGKDYRSEVYEGAEHEENAWAQRLPEIFGWLLSER
ncbi:alpha/beta hydrolase [Parerythrobacter lacustris]|uniref:alpha/beta hydrolase n=1 Tax=Parerythrobacter lacustris TaxID=2969984 RepID=UPI00214CE4BD